MLSRRSSNVFIFVASPEYMLAMKCLSARTENPIELEDIEFLIRHLHLTSIEQVVEIISKFMI